MNKQGQTTLIVVILVILVVFLSIVFFFVFREKGSPDVSVGGFSSFVLTTVDSESKARVGADYSLQRVVYVCLEPTGFCGQKKVGKNQRGCLVWDVVNCSTNVSSRFDGSDWVLDSSFPVIVGNVTSNLEVFDRAVNGSDYLFEASAKNYYRGERLCSEGMVECVLSLDRKPVFVFDVDQEKILFSVKEGLIKGGILCLAWEHPILWFELKDLEEVGKPDGLRIFYDVCYVVPEISGNQSFFFRKEGFGKLKLLLLGDFVDTGNLSLVKQV